MSKTTKIVLSIVGVLVLIGGLLVFAIVRLAGDAIAGPGQAEDIGQRIRVFTLPPAYEPTFGVDLFGLKLLTAIGDTDDDVLMLMELPTADLDSASDDAQTTFQDQTGQAGNYEYSGSREVEILGESRTVDTLLGSQGGRDFRQDLVVFPAASGNVAVAILVGPTDSFDESAFDAFLRSLR